MNKHAYLIIAHNNFYILKKLLSLIDDERNDIYIHIDKKVKKFNRDEFQSICRKSKIYFIKRINIYWGDYSQVECELNLLKVATKGNYEYYHLLSGVDLPIKSQNYIHDYFDKHAGTEFIRFAKDWDYNRVGMIHILNRFNKTNNPILQRLKIYLNKPFVFMYKHGYDYMEKYNYAIKKGDNWFSITNAAAKYILSRKKIIKKLFKYSNCPDEHFIHTILYNSDFRNHISYNTCLREIDWLRGLPYIYKNDDYDLLISSNNLFARKFDVNIDKEIIDRIYQYILQKQKETL